MEQFSNEEKCRESLTHLRWPKGIKWLRCVHDKVSPVNQRKVYDCNLCHYQFSAIVDAMSHDSHLPLTTGFVVTYLMTESKKGISASQVYRMLGKKSYKTAWYLCHRIRAAMAAAEDRPKLSVMLEVDETFLGGRQRGHQQKVGHPESKKQVVIGIRQRGRALRFFHAQDVKSGTLAKYIEENVAHDVDVIMTDEFGANRTAIAKAGVLAEHKTVCHKDGEYLNGDVYTNTVESAFSLLKRGIVGTWHRISAKHLQCLS